MDGRLDAQPEGPTEAPEPTDKPEATEAPEATEQPEADNDDADEQADVESERDDDAANETPHAVQPSEEHDGAGGEHESGQTETAGQEHDD